MLCLLVNAFRDKPVKEALFTDWTKIQSFVNNNVNKFTREILDLKQKILEQPPLHTEKFMKIRTEFFSGNNKTLFKSLATNKNLKVIV